MQELMTCDPSFYADTQRIFLLLHQRGLAYQAEAEVNWDPVDKTVLANEQVDSNGFSWRSGAKVEKRQLKQWFFKITEYKEALLNDMAQLERDNAWPSRVTSMQKNWLGKSEGANITFKLDHEETGNLPKIDPITVFTTRPDTLYGVQYLALSVDHPLVTQYASTSAELKNFIDSVRAAGPEDKAGFKLPGVQAYNPLRYVAAGSSPANKPLPVYVAPYVLGEYGTGAVMGVPAHDTRDFAFWKQNSKGSTVTRVIEPLVRQKRTAKPEAFTSTGRLNSACGLFGGLTSEQASLAIVETLQSASGQAEHVEKWRLRDWLVSRQRYWGTPIPIIYCDSCGAVPVPENHLPVELPSLQKGHFTSQGGNPLEHAADWLNTTCPKCSGPAKRETDTMDTFVDSSWYYLRFARSAEKQEGSHIMPVDVYVGGVEHAILHLLYARFIAKFLSTTPMWSSIEGPKDIVEPFSKLIAQGMVHGRTLTDPETKRILKPGEVDDSSLSNPKIKATGQAPIITFEKMSKSKYNGVDPADCLGKYGADVTRAHLLFSAPVSDVLDWDEEKISGVQRWFGRVWQMTHDVAERTRAAQTPAVSETDASQSFTTTTEAELWKNVQETIQSVEQSFSTTYSLNTIVSDLMQLTNHLHRTLAESQSPNTATTTIAYHAHNILLRLLAPIAPSFAEECWDVLHRDRPATSKHAFQAGFPAVDGSLQRFQAQSQPCAVQVNGKLKFATNIQPPPEGLSGLELQDWVLEKAFASEEGREAMKRGGWDVQEAKKIIVARGGRTVNLVFAK